MDDGSNPPLGKKLDPPLIWLLIWKFLILSNSATNILLSYVLGYKLSFVVTWACLYKSSTQPFANEYFDNTLDLLHEHNPFQSRHKRIKTFNRIIVLYPLDTSIFWPHKITNCGSEINWGLHHPIPRILENIPSFLIQIHFRYSGARPQSQSVQNGGFMSRSHIHVNLSRKHGKSHARRITRKWAGRRPRNSHEDPVTSTQTP